MNVDSDLLKLLMEIGFIATNTGRLGEAETIFGGLTKVRPSSGYPRIGLGCVAMGRGDFSKAANILRSTPTQEKKERDLCQGFLGMALKLGGYEDEYRSVLNQLIADGENEVAIRMAEKLMEIA